MCHAQHVGKMKQEMASSPYKVSDLPPPDSQKYAEEADSMGRRRLRIDRSRQVIAKGCKLLMCDSGQVQSCSKLRSVSDQHW